VQRHAARERSWEWQWAVPRGGEAVLADVRRRAADLAEALAALLTGGGVS
jgi:hypothetical protein